MGADYHQRHACLYLAGDGVTGAHFLVSDQKTDGGGRTVALAKRHGGDCRYDSPSNSRRHASRSHKVFSLFRDLPDEIAIVLLDESVSLSAGQEISRTQRIVDVPVGEALLGRVVDSLGRPIDEGGPLRSSRRRPIERPATAIMDRDPVSIPLQTGIQAYINKLDIRTENRKILALGQRVVRIWKNWGCWWMNGYLC